MTVTSSSAPTFLPSNTLALVVAANVRAVAATRGLNQSDIARAMGVARATISVKWRGQRPWSLDDLEQLSQLLQIEPARLFTELLATIEEAGLGRWVPADTAKAPAEDEGPATVRHQGLEPRTRWFGACTPHDLGRRYRAGLQPVGAGSVSAIDVWELAA